MNRKILKKIILTIIALIAIYIPKCYAAGASISTNVLNAKPGDTVELYIDLSTASIGYDLQITTDNNTLISSSEMINKIGNGDVSRIYLVQLAGSADRTTYSAGTRIATIKYTISETAIEGNKITFSVVGNVAGQTSSDKNSMSESVTINIIKPVNEEKELTSLEATLSGEEQISLEKEKSTEEEQIPLEKEKSTEEEQISLEKEKSTEEEQIPLEKEKSTEEEQIPLEEEKLTEEERIPLEEEKLTEEERILLEETLPQEEIVLQEQMLTEEKDETLAKIVIPDAGVKGVALLAILIIVIMYYSFKKYNKNKDIK